MKTAQNHPTGEFIWPSVTVLFSLLVSAGCIALLAYGLLLILEF